MHSQGPYWGDYNNDGWVDAATWDGVYQNNGGTFSLVADSPQVIDAGQAAYWGDFNNDGRLEYFNPGSTVACFATDDGTFLQQHLPQRPMEVSDGGTVLDIDVKINKFQDKLEDKLGMPELGSSGPRVR